MQPVPISVLASATPRIRPRTALVASADRSFRQRLNEILTGLRWQVREAEGGAQAWTEAETAPPEAIIVDSWLPDLEMAEFLKDFRSSFPEVDLVTAGGVSAEESPRGPYRQELLYALRRIQDTDTAAWNTAPVLDRPTSAFDPMQVAPWPRSAATTAAADSSLLDPARTDSSAVGIEAASCSRLPELVGDAPCMLEISRRVRLVAPRMTTVLIEGPTGSGKEIVAEALHRLSPRSRKPFAAINCAAIPEELLEADSSAIRAAPLPAR